MTFEEFVGQELAGLTRFAGALAGDRWLAEDVLSDALVKVAARWFRIGRMSDPASYVRRVVVSTYLSDRRTAQRRNTLPVDPAEPLPVPVAEDVADGVGNRDEVERLLAQLPRQQRAAVVLRYPMDETDEQIAEELRCSPATVRSHLSQARAALRLATAARSADAPRTKG